MCPNEPFSSTDNVCPFLIVNFELFEWPATIVFVFVYPINEYLNLGEVAGVHQFVGVTSFVQ